MSGVLDSFSTRTIPPFVLSTLSMKSPNNSFLYMQITISKVSPARYSSFRAAAALQAELCSFQSAFWQPVLQYHRVFTKPWAPSGASSQALHFFEASLWHRAQLCPEVFTSSGAASAFDIVSLS